MTTFSELPLCSGLQQKLAAAQFVNLTPIQERAIPPALEGKDVIGTAQTGTGKTLAFLIPIMEMFREPSRNTGALVLLPTRELAMQVHEQYEKLRSKSSPKPSLVIGGVSENKQIGGLRGASGRETRHAASTPVHGKRTDVNIHPYQAWRPAARPGTGTGRIQCHNDSR